MKAVGLDLQDFIPPRVLLGIPHQNDASEPFPKSWDPRAEMVNGASFAL